MILPPLIKALWETFVLVLWFHSSFAPMTLHVTVRFITFFFIRWCRKSNKLIAFSYILEFPFLVSVFHPCWGAHTSVLLVSQALMNGELCLRKCIWYKLSMQIIQNEISIHTGLVKAQFNNECFHCWSKLCCCWQKTKDGRHAKGQWERRKAVEVRGRI